MHRSGVGTHSAVGAPSAPQTAHPAPRLHRGSPLGRREALRSQVSGSQVSAPQEGIRDQNQGTLPCLNQR